MGVDFGRAYKGGQAGVGGSRHSFWESSFVHTLRQLIITWLRSSSCRQLKLSQACGLAVAGQLHYSCSSSLALTCLTRKCHIHILDVLQCQCLAGGDPTRCRQPEQLGNEGWKVGWSAGPAQQTQQPTRCRPLVADGRANLVRRHNLLKCPQLARLFVSHAAGTADTSFPASPFSIFSSLPSHPTPLLHGTAGVRHASREKASVIRERDLPQLLQSSGSTWQCTIPGFKPPIRASGNTPSRSFSFLFFTEYYF